MRPDLREGGGGSGTGRGETLDCDAGGPMTASAVPTGSPELGIALQSCPALAQDGLASIPCTGQTVDMGCSRKSRDFGQGSPLQLLKVCARGVRHTSAYRIHDPRELGLVNPSPILEVASVAKTHMGDLCSQSGSVLGHMNGARTFRSPGPGLWGAGNALSLALGWGHL